MARWCSLGRRLEHARGGRSVSEIARRSGLPRRTVQRLLNGELRPDRGTVGPGLDTIERLAEATGVEPGWLAYGERGQESG